MSVPAESYFDSAQAPDLFIMAAQKLGYVNAAGSSTYQDWWEWIGDPNQQRRRLRWLIDPFPPTSVPVTANCGTIEAMAQAACASAGITRGSDSATEALRRSCRVWAGYAEIPGN